MGLRMCDREGCSTFPCDRLVLGETHYICEECYQELLAYQKTWPERLMLEVARERVHHFFNTPVGAFAEMTRDEAFAHIMQEDDA